MTTERAERPGAGFVTQGALSQRSPSGRAAARWLERAPLLWGLCGLTLCSAALAAGTRRLNSYALGPHELLFIALPPALALLALLRSARSAVGRVVKALLLLLCLAAPLCGESALWLAAGAPFVLGLAALVTLGVSGRR